jgi:hypothetical protein
MGSDQPCQLHEPWALGNRKIFVYLRMAFEVWVVGKRLACRDGNNSWIA